MTLFWRTSLLDEAIEWFDQAGYTIVRLDARRWNTPAEMHQDIAAALDFPDYYGRNLDALNDCLGDVIDYTYGTSQTAAGLLVTISGYDTFVHASPHTAQAVLDIIAGNARLGALTGHRLLCLIRSDDPTITFDSVGAMPVIWNHAERLDARRQAGSEPHPLLP